MSLILEDQVLNLRTVLAKRVNHLIAFPLFHSGIVRTLGNQEGRANR
jgi:hypothetical protein